MKEVVILVYHVDTKQLILFSRRYDGRLRDTWSKVKENVSKRQWGDGQAFKFIDYVESKLDGEIFAEGINL